MRTVQLAVRAALLVAIAVHMQLGGVYEQVLRRGRPPTTMTWRMYAGPGRDVCEVEWFTQERRSGARVPLDRLALLGHEPFWKAPAATRRQHGLDEVLVAAKIVCDRLPGQDVRAEARCAVRGTFRSVLTADEPLCKRRSRP
jgi:hypothetical protein